MESLPVVITSNPDSMEHSIEQQISFAIPSNTADIEHIARFNNLTALLKSGKFENVASVDLSAVGANGDDGFFGKWSTDADYHHIMNYLWIGIVTSLIVMSIVFVVFSCYFYRKFREWKKCNKDIRLQIPNDLYQVSSMGRRDEACYRVESPPCYTIATGLPSYDEALLQAHFTVGAKVFYPWECSAAKSSPDWARSSCGVALMETSGLATIPAVDEFTTETNEKYCQTNDCTEIVVLS